MHMNPRDKENISDYMSVKDAAEFLGVSKDTIRRWDKKGKLKAYRHPMNHYRLYKKADLQAILDKIQRPDSGGKTK